MAMLRNSEIGILNCLILFVRISRFGRTNPTLSPRSNTQTLYSVKAPSVLEISISEEPRQPDLSF